MSRSMFCCLAVLTNSAGNSSIIVPKPPIFAPKPLLTRPISQASMATRKVCCSVGMSIPLCMVALTSSSPTRPFPHYTLIRLFTGNTYAIYHHSM